MSKTRYDLVNVALMNAPRGSKPSTIRVSLFLIIRRVVPRGEFQIDENEFNSDEWKF